MLLAKRRETHPTERAQLFGKRMVTTIEVEEGRRLAESMVKHLTGSDIITARRMREDPWSFKPTHTIVRAANHRPEIRGTDHAIWRRNGLVDPPEVLTATESYRAEMDVLGDRPCYFTIAALGCISNRSKDLWHSQSRQDTLRIFTFITVDHGSLEIIS